MNRFALIKILSVSAEISEIQAAQVLGIMLESIANFLKEGNTTTPAFIFKRDYRNFPELLNRRARHVCHVHHVRRGAQLTFGNRTGLIAACKLAGISEFQANRGLQEIFKAISYSLRKGHSVHLGQYGVFFPERKASRFSTLGPKRKTGRIGRSRRGSGREPLQTRHSKIACSESNLTFKMSILPGTEDPGPSKQQFGPVDTDDPGPSDKK